jgi:Zn ribbon nucleic-acid-binding protein
MNTLVCPECHSTNVRATEDDETHEITLMECRDCGFASTPSEFEPDDCPDEAPEGLARIPGRAWVD